MAVDTAINDSVSPTPLFMTTGGTATPEEIAFALVNNTRIIQVMSAEFACYDVATTSLAKMAPEVVGIAPIVCSISIPPYAGKFSGYLNLCLTRKPSNEEQNVLRDAARAIASDIFDRELAR
jgi:hypothetical protein